MRDIISPIPEPNSASLGETGQTPPRGSVKLREVPRHWPESVQQKVDYFCPTKFRAVSQAQRVAIKPSHKAALEESVFREVPRHSVVSKWMPRGFASVPTTSEPVNVIYERVPDKYDFWLESIQLYISPDTHQTDFHWMVIANGIDILNFGNLTRYPAVPMNFGHNINFGSTRDQQVLIPAGSLIKVVIIALPPMPAWTDIAEASMLGSLVGVR